jgi:peptide/nickel transport system permease protein
MVEMIPTMTSLLLACFLTNALYAVLEGSGLQFLGLGDPSMVSWGTTLYWADSQGALQSGLYLWEIVPGLCIALLGAAFALLNYAFDEISNPALRPLRTKKARKRAALAIPVGRELATDDAHVG